MANKAPLDTHTIRVDATVWSRAVKRSVKERRSISEVLRFALEEWLAGRLKLPPLS